MKASSNPPQNSNKHFFPNATQRVEICGQLLLPSYRIRVSRPYAHLFRLPKTTAGAAMVCICHHGYLRGQGFRSVPDCGLEINADGDSGSSGAQASLRLVDFFFG